MLSEFQKFRLRRSHLVVVRYCCGSPHESKGEIGTYFVRASALLRQNTALPLHLRRTSAFNLHTYSQRQFNLEKRQFHWR